MDHEYLLCYAHPGFSFAGVGKDLSTYKNYDPGNPDPWKRGDLSKPHDYRTRPGGFYPIYNEAEDIWYPSNPKRVWAFASNQLTKPGQKLRRETMEDLIAAGKVVFPKDDQVAVYQTIQELRSAIMQGVAPRYLQLGLFETTEEEEKYLSFFVGKRIGFGTPGYKRFRSEVKSASKPLSTWITGLKDKEDNDEVTILRSGLNAEGTTLLGQIFSNASINFSYPKPLSLIQTLIEQATGPDDTILDFFAGSGTTAHAVLALNASEETSDRRFILVSSTEATTQQPDKNICRDVTRERVKRAIEGYSYRSRAGQVEVEGLGGDFAYLQANRIEMERLFLGGIQHEQIWTALQLIHVHEVDEYQSDKDMQQLWTDEQVLVYLPEISSSTLDRLGKLTDSANRPITVYTWQPPLVEQHLMVEHVNIYKIPDELVKRFGGTP